MRIVISVDHMGRLGRRAGDRGAAHGSMYEVDLTWRIAEAFYQAGRNIHDVIVASHGDYGDRHRWSNANDVDVYLALHINASSNENADYGAFFFHPNTKPGNGDRLAEIMAGEMMKVARSRRYPDFKAKAIRAAGDVWKNPRYVIGGLKKPVGICCEPFFISSPVHRRAFCNTPTLIDIGRAYLSAVEEWERAK